jgi:hypothetical protein
MAINLNPLTLAEPPYSSPLVDSTGSMTPSWSKWFQQLYLRVGGANAAPLSNIIGASSIALISTYAATGLTTLYTSPLGQKTILSAFSVKNVSPISQTISVYFVPQGATAGADNIVLNTVSIPAGTTVPFSDLAYKVISGAGFIQAFASQSLALQISADGWVST